MIGQRTIKRDVVLAYLWRLLTRRLEGCLFRRFGLGIAMAEAAIVDFQAAKLNSNMMAVRIVRQWLETKINLENFDRGLSLRLDAIHAIEEHDEGCDGY